MEAPESKARGVGRPRKAMPDVPREALKRTRAMSKEYENAKFRTVMYPKIRPTFMKQMHVDRRRYEEAGNIEYDRAKAERIAPDDRRIIAQYASDMRLVWLLENGVASIKDELTKKIAEDTLLNRKRCVDAAAENKISVRTCFREKKRALHHVATFMMLRTE